MTCEKRKIVQDKKPKERRTATSSHVKIFKSRKEKKNIFSNCWVSEAMDYEENDSFQSKDVFKEDKLFNAVESNSISLVESFDADELCRLCLKRRVFPSEWSSPYEEAQSAYQRACLLGRTEIAQCMINAGVEVDQTFSGGTSHSTMRGAFLFACQSRSISIITTLLNAGASCDKLGSCTLAYVNSVAPDMSLFGGYTRPTVSWENFYPIHLAILYNNLPMLQKFIQPSGLELLTIQYHSPLHLACQLNRSLTMIDLLLSFEDANDAIMARALHGKYPDEFASDPTIIEYLRPTRLRLCAQLEKIRQRKARDDLKELEEGTAFQVFIQNLKGKTLIIVVRKEDSVQDLKEKIRDKEAVPPDDQQIIYGGKQLQDNKTLSDYDISKDATLHLVIRLRGGYHFIQY